MNNLLKLKGLFVGLAGAILIVGCGAQAHAQQEEDPKTSDRQISAIISAAELKELIDSNEPGLKILEPSKDAEVFAEGHLSAARFLHWVDDLTDPANKDYFSNPQPEDFAELMSRHGIQNSDRIVIYDRLSSRLSTRLYWTLKVFGHDQIQILDGGLEAWKAAGYELSNEAPVAAESSYEVSETRADLVAEMDYVTTQLAEGNTRLIDGRPADQFSGEKAGTIYHTQVEHPKRGHIPGAVNVFWKDNFNPDGTFKSVEELRELYKNANVLPDNCVITYCNEGLHAAPPWFVLTQLLEYENVKLYDNSMAEWAKSSNPVEEN